jgi:hypothetical protein
MPGKFEIKKTKAGFSFNLKANRCTHRLQAVRPGLPQWPSLLRMPSRLRLGND